MPAIELLHHFREEKKTYKFNSKLNKFRQKKYFLLITLVRSNNKFLAFFFLPSFVSYNSFIIIHRAIFSVWETVCCFNLLGLL